MSTEFLTDLMTPMAVRVAATLRIADHIDAGIDDPERLATATGADARALVRLMRFLVVRNVFEEPKPGHYALTPVSRRLRTGTPLQAWLDLEGAGARMELSYTDLLYSIRTGTAAWEHFYGKPMWEDLAGQPELDASFNQLMAQHCAWLAPSLIDGYDWSDVDHLVDVGGGDGTLLTEILCSRTGLRGTLVEQPHLESQAKERIRQAGVEDRCTYVGGSFFDPLPTADVYLLANVIHNWPDQQAAQILTRCAEAAPAPKVLIVEWAISGTNALRETEMDLRNLVLLNGEERTLPELENLGARAGLTVLDFVTLKSGLSLIVMGRDATRPAS
ncbi:methyltransferase [Nocardia sp. NPDC050406]|uniref:methyltransferase n=1 Tax=Nocardia sp. NPDC050406 TaxID=3364318 RepID=UPI003792BB4F